MGGGESVELSTLMSLDTRLCTGVCPVCFNERGSCLLATEVKTPAVKKMTGANAKGSYGPQIRDTAHLLYCTST